MTKREAQHIMNGMFTYLKKYDEVTFDVSLLGTDIEHFPDYFEKHGYKTKKIPILDMFKELFLEIINTHKRKLYDEVDTDWGDFHYVTFYVLPGKKVIDRIVVQTVFWILLKKCNMMNRKQKKFLFRTLFWM